MTTAKRIPQRTCVGCRTTSGKREFVRIVRAPEGRVEVDTTGRQDGRGAYVCAQLSCWQEALTKDRLARALRTTIAPEDREALKTYAQQFAPAGVGV